MATRRVNVRGIIYKDGKLLAQTFNTSGGGETNYWGTPGGGLDEGESLHDGLRREMIEETGIAPEIGKLLFVQQFHNGEKEKLEFFFHIKNADDYQTIDLTATTHGIEEISRVEFVNPHTEPVLPAFLQTIDLTDYIDKNLPVYVDSELPILAR